MSYFSKGRKDDITRLALEIGIPVTEKSTIATLRDAILKMPDYDEIFVKGILDNFIAEREESAEAKRISEERMFELQKLRPIESRETKTSIHTTKDITKLVSKLEDGGNIHMFLDLFERQARRMQIPEEEYVTHLLGLVPLQITQIITQEEEGKVDDYQYIKKVLLSRFRWTSETFKRLFHEFRKTQDITWKDFSFKLTNFFNEWITGVGVKNLEQLKELIISDQIKARTTEDIKYHFIDRFPDMNQVAEVVEALEKYEAVRFSTKPNINKEFRKTDHQQREPPDLRKINQQRREQPPKQLPWQERRQSFRIPHAQDIRCYGCGQQGHRRSECPNWRPGDQYRRPGPSAPLTFKKQEPPTKTSHYNDEWMARNSQKAQKYQSVPQYQPTGQKIPHLLCVQLELPGIRGRAIHVPAVLDSGSTISVIPQRFVRLIKYEDEEVSDVPIFQTSGRLSVKKLIVAETTLRKVTRKVLYHVIDSPLPYCLLSIGHIRDFKLCINFNRMLVFQQNVDVTYKYHNRNFNFNSYYINHLRDVLSVDEEEYEWGGDTLTYYRKGDGEISGNENCKSSNVFICKGGEYVADGKGLVRGGNRKSFQYKVKSDGECPENVIQSKINVIKCNNDEKDCPDVKNISKISGNMTPGYMSSKVKNNVDNVFSRRNNDFIVYKRCDWNTGVRKKGNKKNNKKKKGKSEREKISIEEVHFTTEHGNTACKQTEPNLFDVLPTDEVVESGSCVASGGKMVPGEEKILLNQEMEKQLDRVLEENKCIFSTDKFDVGLINLAPPRVILTSDLPISLRPYRASPKDNAEIKSQIDQLLKAGFIKPSYSAYAAPVTMAYKRDDGDKTRMCIDYRKLNVISETDSEPVPRIDNILDQLSSAKIFSNLDLTSGYWHVGVSEKDAEKLAFTTNFGLYQWCRLPFGWKNSGAVFQRALRQILQKYQINFALNYFDDIIIFSDSFSEHLEHLKEIFKVCKLENMKLKFSKCQFAKTKLNFLGYEIQNGSYSPSNPNIETIKKLLPPKNAKELQRFLGSVNVYHKFIPDYAKIRGPLNKLLQKDAQWCWTKQCQDAFEKLKLSLISKPVLALFNPKYPCHLFVDASGEAIGAVIKQQHPDGTLHPISYNSRRLKKYEEQYAITELECLAIVDAVDKFHCYLHGSPFVIHTDHAALVWLRKVKHLTGRLFRWSLKLSMYDYEIRYKKGITNYEADMLSRNPISHHTTHKVHLLTLEEIKESQERELIGNPKFIKNNEIWTIRKKGFNKIVVPFGLRLKLLETTHKNFGHPGVKKMINLISPEYYWKNIQVDIANFVKHCETCQLGKKSNQKKFGLLESLPPTHEPFDILSIDTVGGLSYYNSPKRYLHVIIDHATRYVWTFPSKNATSETYGNILKQVFNVQLPRNLLSDRNPAFTSAKFRRFLNNNHVKQLLTSSSHPQTNGKTERINQNLVARLRCKIQENPHNVPWPKLLEQVTREYNDTPHSVTKFSPSFLMYGTFPYISPLPGSTFQYPSVEEARILAEKRTIEEHRKNKIRYDKKFCEPKFEVNDLIICEEIQYPNLRKLTAPFSGPFRILRQTSNVNFEIDRKNHLTKKNSEIVHASKLRPFFPFENFKLQEEPTSIPS